MPYNRVSICTESDFDEIFRENFNHLVLYVTSIVKSENIAEDIVQEMFIRLWNKRNQVIISNVFMYVCAKNAAFSFLRTKKIMCDITTISLSDNQFEDIEQEMEYHEKIESVASQIIKLSPMCRKTIEKIYFENKKYHEAAEELCISVNTVKYHLKTAIAIFKKSFLSYFF